MTITFEAYNLSTGLFLELEIPFTEESFAEILSLPHTRNIQIH